MQLLSCAIVCTMLTACEASDHKTSKKKFRMLLTDVQDYTIFQETETTTILTEDPTEKPSESATSGTNAVPTEEASTSSHMDTISEPVLLWCQVYDSEDTHTVTGVLYNPNATAIDVTYDLVYYKDGVEVARNKECSNFSIGPQEKDVIWTNWDVPAPVNVDEIRLEKVLVDESYYESIEGTYTAVETAEQQLGFEIAFARTPTVANVWVLFYNDTNTNGECDQGELVATEMKVVLQQKEVVYFDIDAYEYTNYEIIYNAY